MPQWFRYQQTVCVSRNADRSIDEWEKQTQRKGEIGGMQGNISPRSAAAICSPRCQRTKRWKRLRKQLRANCLYWPSFLPRPRFASLRLTYTHHCYHVSLSVYMHVRTFLRTRRIPRIENCDTDDLSQHEKSRNIRQTRYARCTFYTYIYIYTSKEFDYAC